MKGFIRHPFVRRIGVQSLFYLMLSAVMGGLMINKVNLDLSEHRAEGVKEISQIAIEKALELFQKDKAIFIDARNVGHYQKAHIPGAISMPISNLDERLAKHLELFSVNKYVVIYCESESCDLSELLARKLVSMGIDNVFIFRGGLDAWKNARLPTESKS